jgi:hypothetical protein
MLNIIQMLRENIFFKLISTLQDYTILIFPHFRRNETFWISENLMI